MNSEIQRLLTQLNASDEAKQEDAVLSLSLILERHIPKYYDDPIHRVFLSEDVLQLVLSTEEKEELVTTLCSTVLSEQLPISRRASLAGALAKCGHLNALGAALNVFMQLGHVLDDDSAYSIMACITPSLHIPDHHDAILKLIEKYETPSVLEQLARRECPRLMDAIQYFHNSLSNLRGLKSTKRTEAEKPATLVQADETQTKFLQLLYHLTALGKLAWARSEHERGFVYCLADDELIVFELRGDGNAVPVKPHEKVAGIVSKCRNVTYLWLEGLHDWDKLLDLLKRVPENHEGFVMMRKRSHQSPIHALESLLTEQT